MELNQSDILNPMEVLNDWMKEVSEAEKQPNPNCFSIATTNQEGSSNVRIVLCKEINIVDGYVVFFSNYNSPKSIAFESHNQIAALFYWSSTDTQIRLKARINKTSAAYNDEYFKKRSTPPPTSAPKSVLDNFIT